MLPLRDVFNLCVIISVIWVVKNRTQIVKYMVVISACHIFFMCSLSLSIHHYIKLRSKMIKTCENPIEIIELIGFDPKLLLE